MVDLAGLPIPRSCSGSQSGRGGLLGRPAPDDSPSCWPVGSPAPPRRPYARLRDRHGADALPLPGPATRRPRVAELDALNIALVNAIDADGRIYLTQTPLIGEIAIRFQVGQFETTEEEWRFREGI